MSIPQAHFISQQRRPIQNPPLFQSGFQTSSILLSGDTVFPLTTQDPSLLLSCGFKTKKPDLFGLFHGYLWTCRIPLIRTQGSTRQGRCLLELRFTEGLRQKIRQGAKISIRRVCLYHPFLWLTNKWKCGPLFRACGIEKTILFQRTESRSRHTRTRKGNEGTGAGEH